MQLVVLNQRETQVLDAQDATSERRGGFQKLLVTLQRLVNRATGELLLSRTLLERIPRYAFDYGNGGWEDRLKAIFSRTLGPKLGR